MTIDREIKALDTQISGTEATEAVQVSGYMLRNTAQRRGRSDEAVALQPDAGALLQGGNPPMQHLGGVMQLAEARIDTRLAEGLDVATRDVAGTLTQGVHAAEQHLNGVVQTAEAQIGARLAEGLDVATRNVAGTLTQGVHAAEQHLVGVTQAAGAHLDARMAEGAEVMARNVTGALVQGVNAAEQHLGGVMQTAEARIETRLAEGLDVATRNVAGTLTQGVHAAEQHLVGVTRAAEAHLDARMVEGAEGARRAVAGALTRNVDEAQQHLVGVTNQAQTYLESQLTAAVDAATRNVSDTVTRGVKDGQQHLAGVTQLGNQQINEARDAALQQMEARHAEQIAGLRRMIEKELQTALSRIEISESLGGRGPRATLASDSASGSVENSAGTKASGVDSASPALETPGPGTGRIEQDRKSDAMSVASFESYGSEFDRELAKLADGPQPEDRGGDGFQAIDNDSVWGKATIEKIVSYVEGLEKRLDSGLEIPKWGEGSIDGIGDLTKNAEKNAPDASRRTADWVENPRASAKIPRGIEERGRGGRE